MKNSLILSLILGSSLLSASPFDQGRVGVGVEFGTGEIQSSEVNNRQYDVENSYNYSMIGLSAEIFPASGLSIGLSARKWFNAKPETYDMSIPITYYVPISHNGLVPYVGGVYRYHYNVGVENHLNVLGGRLGFAFYVEQAYMTFGWVEEFSIGDVKTQYNVGYAEFKVGITF